VGIGVGVAGCLSSGSNITYPEQTGESDGSEEPDETESPEESEEPSGTPINTRLADETTRVYDELRWFETEYDATMQQYRSRLRDVYTETESLLETIADEGRLDAQPLEDVETLAADVASTVTEIPEPQFTNHISFAAVNDDGFPEAKRFRDREDWDRVEDELEYVARIYGNASTIKATKERYSPNPIDNRLYGWLGGDEAGTMFEIRHLSDDPDQHDDADQRLPGHGVYVVSDSSREIEYLDRPMGGDDTTSCRRWTIGSLRLQRQPTGAIGSTFGFTMWAPVAASIQPEPIRYRSTDNSTRTSRPPKRPSRQSLPMRRSTSKSNPKSSGAKSPGTRCSTPKTDNGSTATFVEQIRICSRSTPYGHHGKNVTTSGPNSSAAHGLIHNTRQQL